jgi:phosphate-selective porin OprO/OprP
MKRNFQSVLIALLAVGFALGTQPMAQAKTKHKRRATSQPSGNAALQQRVDELEQNQKVLERKWELDKEAAEQKEKEEAKDKTVVKAGSDGFIIQSADGNYKLRVGGYIQTDGRFFIHDTGDRLANQFELRRVRPILEGTVYKWFDFRLMPDFGEGKVVLQDAYADIHPWLFARLRGGKFKSPVGLERLQSATNLLFIERGLPTNLVPNRDLGMMFHGEAFGGTFQYALALLDGTFDNGIIDGDVSDGKDFAGRLFVQPFKKTKIKFLQGFGAGIAGTYGSQFGSLANTNLPSYKSIGQNTIFSYLNDGTGAGTVVSNGSRYRISPQGYFYYGPFGLFGEYVLSTQNVSLNSTQRVPITNKSWQVAASYVITGEKASYTGVVPKNPINPKKGHWGAFEVAGRYGELEIDPAAFPTFADPTKSVRKTKAWGVGLNWYLTKNFKWQLNFDQSRFTGGAKGGNRANENALFTRMQVAF